MSAEPTDLEDLLSGMQAALENAEGELSVRMGGLQETSRVRVWQGQVLVDWERDEQAGGCLLRPALVRRLALLGARFRRDGLCHRITAPAQVVRALSPYHERLAAHTPRPPSLELTLRFDADAGYQGGEERYEVRGQRDPSTVLLLAVTLHRRSAAPSARTSLEPS